MFFLILFRQEFELFFLNALYVWVLPASISVCLCTMCVLPGGRGCWESSLEILELEVQVVVSCHADFENRTLAFRKIGKCS